MADITDYHAYDDGRLVRLPIERYQRNALPFDAAVEFHRVDAQNLIYHRAAQLNLLRGKHGAKKAICAVAASMLTAIYHMLKDGTHHHDLGANHFDRRSTEIKAKRLAAQIVKLGYQASLQPLAQPA